MLTVPYLEQRKRWPHSGRHILAHYDDESIVVYQAYRPEIGRYAVHNQRFGGEFSYSRMSWIKTNFLWMMYRSAWGTKQGQEITLAVRLRRDFFETLLERAVPSGYDSSVFETHEQWKKALHRSTVRLQWDPDHGPTGAKRTRKAIQLGLRGETLKRYGTEALLEINDISEFVSEQRETGLKDNERLLLPLERVYSPASAKARTNVGLSPVD